MKSRTVVGRTFAKVKNRISSIGSLVSINSESPNPLLAPPDPIASPPLPKSAPIPPHTNDPTPSPSLDGAAPSPASNAPPIAALSIKTESWTVFNAHPKYHTTAYVKFDISCVTQSAGIHTPLDHSSTVDAGHLHTLTLDLSLTGPAITISHYGNLTTSTLKANEHWINLLHIGIKDTSLASKLSTSLRSLGRSAGRSAGRLGRYTNIDLINKWLHVLESDDDGSSGGREPVVVNATVRYKHSLLPEHTMCLDEVGCSVKMGKGERERAEMTVELEGQRTKRSGSDEDGHETSEDEEEERVREARVLGAPWL